MHIVPRASPVRGRDFFWRGIDWVEVMTDWATDIKHWIWPKPAAHPRLPESSLVPAGIYHYPRERDGQNLRYHLRVERSGQGVLLAAASEGVRLSAAGVTIAKALLDGQPVNEVAESLPFVNAATVVKQIQHTIHSLGVPGPRYPIFDLIDPVASVGPHGLIAPFQADVVLGESADMPVILRSLWIAGIFHARFIDIEKAPLDRLAAAVEQAEDLGMITGIRGRASFLIEQKVIPRVAEMGLDYLVIPWGVTTDRHAAIFGEADSGQLRAALGEIAKWEMAAVADAPLSADVTDSFEEEVRQLKGEGVRNFEVYSLAYVPAAANEKRANDPADVLTSAGLRPFAADALRQWAGWIEDLADNQDVQISWLPSLECTHAHDFVALARGGPRAGGDISIRVEADGRVIPPRGPAVSAGRIQHDSWDQIWNHSAFRKFRSLIESERRCSVCPRLTICAADCPADPMGWAQESHSP